MKQFRFYTYIVLIILVLPLFYSYFNLLPSATRYVLDLTLLAYILTFRNLTVKRTAFTRLYLGYIFFITLITVFSLIIHEESISYLIPEVRRLIVPLVLYLIVTDLFESYNLASIRAHKLFIAIMITQIPVTILQTVFFSKFKQLNLFDFYRHFLDAATGTLGEAGHAYLGILIPLTCIYLYDLKLFKYTIPFIIPLILINSGGGIVLFAAVFLCIGVHSLFNGKMVHRARILAGIGVLIGILFIFSRTEIFKTNFYSYTRSFLFYTEHYILGGAETFIGQEHKISRFNGYKLLKRKMDNYDYEQLFGLGFEFKETLVKGKPLSFKNDLNSIIAERGFLGLLAYGVFIVLFMINMYNTLRVGRHEQIFIKMLLFAAFFAGGLYNQTSRSFTVWCVLIYFMALFENKEQYDRLVNFIKFKTLKIKTKVNKAVVNPIVTSKSSVSIDKT